VNPRSGLLKAGIALLGYFAAVVVAALTTIFFKGALESFYLNTKHLHLMLLGGFAVTFATAFPGFLIALILAAVFQWRAWLPFSIAGGFNALLSLLIFKAGIDHSISLPPASFLIPCCLGGVVGGFAYWAVARRFLAKMRDRARA
jgi:hypothetical protein